MRAFRFVLWWVRCVMALCLLLAANAGADPVCPEAALTSCRGRDCRCSKESSIPQNDYDPVNITYGTTLHTATDFEMTTAQGPISFYRRYTSDVRALTYAGNYEPPYHNPFETQAAPLISRLPTPFGSSTAGAMYWWHNLYTFVKVWSFSNAAQTKYLHMMTPDGQPRLYECNTSRPCPNGSIIPNKDPEKQRGEFDRLRYDANGKLEWIRQDGFIYRYESPFSVGGKTWYFLTSVEQPRQFSTPLFTLTYGDPGLPGCPNDGTGNWVPYLKYLDAWDGARLRFKYKKLPHGGLASGDECVLDRVEIEDRPLNEPVGWKHA